MPMQTTYDGWDDLALPDVPDLDAKNTQVSYTVLNVLSLDAQANMLSVDFGEYDTLEQAQLAAAESFKVEEMWMIRENRIVEISGGLITAITRASMKQAADDAARDTDHLREIDSAERATRGL